MVGQMLSAARIGLKRILKSALGLPGLLFARSQPCMRVLFYHRVNPYPKECLGPVSREITVHPDEFAWQMRYLAEHGYRVVNLADFEAIRMSGQVPRQNCVLITFDDGFEDNLLFAAPVLQQYGFPAVVFVIADFLGKCSADVWPFADSPRYGRFLTREQISTLLAADIQVGSHSLTHPPLTKLDADRLGQEISGSRLRLEEMFGAPVRSFAYPGGDFDARVEEVVARAGYAAAFTTSTGATAPAERSTALSRTEVSASDSRFVFRMKLSGALDWLSVKDSAPMRRMLSLSSRILMPLAKGAP